MSRLEQALRVCLRTLGVRSRHITTELARHHVYETTSRGRLPTIVFLPGLVDSATTLIPVLARLRGRARRLLVVESAGHGLSGPARGEYTVARHLASITAALDQILDERAILAGNSLGGATALHYAHARPGRVRGLYLTSPGGAPIDAEGVANLRRAFTMRTTADARAFVDLVFHRSPALAPVFARVIRQRAASPAVAAILQTLESEHAAPTALAALTIPVMLLWGRSERILPSSALTYLRTHLPGHASIVEPEGFGHCPHLDDPARFARLLEVFAGAT